MINEKAKQSVSLSIATQPVMLCIYKSTDKGKAMHVQAWTEP